jgi:Ca-activated chloride channel family protein
MMLHQSRLGLLLTTFSLTLLGACTSSNSPSPQALQSSQYQGFEVKLLVGSALGEFCQQAATQLNQQQPKLQSGEAFYVTCEAAGSGDVVAEVEALAEQFKNGTLPADAPEFPTLLSVDGDIYQSLLIHRIEQLFPGQTYVPDITESPLLANSPMVFMTSSDLAPGLRKTEDLYKSLVTARTHQDIDPASPAIAINYVHTAPTRSNSGLQSLVAQYASVAAKRPEQLTVQEVTQFTPQIQQIQSKITRYGISTDSLSKSMVQNGPFWASVASVYESSVIAANAALPPGQTRYEAVYPKATFTSNMRAILPAAPWVSDQERAAAEQVIEYLRSPAIQQIATSLGLRPGTPGVPLGAKFTPAMGVDPQAQYDSLRPPQPAVVEVMIQSWQEIAKKPSLVVVVIDSSGSMMGNKMPAAQTTLQNYINNLGPKDQIALIDFDSIVREPVQIDGTPAGRNRGLAFVSGLQIGGGTALYNATLSARDWLQQNLRPDAINAILVLTDGADTDSTLTLDALKTELQASGFRSDQRIAVFTVGYGNEGEFNPEVLQQIAGDNGGYYSKGDPNTISQVIADLQVEF